MVPTSEENFSGVMVIERGFSQAYDEVDLGESMMGRLMSREPIPEEAPAMLEHAFAAQAPHFPMVAGAHGHQLPMVAPGGQQYATTIR